MRIIIAWGKDEEKLNEVLPRTERDDAKFMFSVAICCYLLGLVSNVLITIGMSMFS